MRIVRVGVLTIFVAFFSGCIHGYVAPAPKGYRGDLMINQEGVVMTTCRSRSHWFGVSQVDTCMSPVRFCPTCRPVPKGTRLKIVSVFRDESDDAKVDLFIGSERIRVRSVSLNWLTTVVEPISSVAGD